MTIWHWLGLLDGVLLVWGTLYILSHPREARAMLAWLLVFLFLPVLGVLLFLFIGDPKFHRVRKRRKRRRRHLSQVQQRLQTLRRDHDPLDNLAHARHLQSFVHLARRMKTQLPTTGNQVCLYFDGETLFSALLESIAQARHHVHLEYYIVNADGSGQRLCKVLSEKARAGVECRLLLDAVGSWWLSRRYVRQLRAAGVQVHFFLPVIPWRGRWRVNFRNHRKIAVIDGALGFVGSQNIGDEYLGLDKEFPTWHDTHLSLRGPAVQELQEVFAEDWHDSGGTELAADCYFPEPSDSGEQIVQILPSGPDANTATMHHLLMAVFATAQRQIRIVTPYFVPDQTMLLTLQAAAYRGLQVQLLVPNRSDHRLVLWAGRSCYRELCDAGVEIYEYREGMLHSKVVVVDETWALVGSANMDERSFRLNFEVTALLYDQGLARQLQDDFDALRDCPSTLHICPDVLPSFRPTFRQRLGVGVARLISPLL